MSKRKVRYQAPEGSLRAALEQLPDVRRGQGLEHPLGGVLALAVCAVLCGARSQDAVSQWGQDCGPEIRAALGLKRERGPSGPPVQRVFRQLDHAAFERVLGQWFAAQGLQADEAMASDGKTLRGMPGEEVPGVHLVAAFAQRTRTVLAQVATQGKGHELAGGQGSACCLARPASCLGTSSRGMRCWRSAPSAARSWKKGGLFFRLEGEPAADTGGGGRELCRPVDPTQAGSEGRSAGGPRGAADGASLDRGSALLAGTGDGTGGRADR